MKPQELRMEWDEVESLEIWYKKLTFIVIKMRNQMQLAIWQKSKEGRKWVNEL